MARIWVLVSVLLAMTSGCVAGEAGPPGEVGQVAIEVARLALTSVTDARYRVTVTNAADGGGETVWTKELLSSRFGDGAGALTYVGPCDADVPGGINTVTLELLALYEGATEIDTDTWVAPPPLALEAVCVANTDVAVTFDITVVRDAKQGFFDVAVAFDDIFCSAKLDCLDADGELELLYNPNTGGRDLTAVLAFACTSSPTGDTWLYLDDPVITCTGQAGPVRVNAAGLGNLDLTQAPNTNPGDFLFGAAVYRGDEALAGKSYWNFALGLDSESFANLGTCTLEARATASSEAWPLEVDGFHVPENTIYPVLDWNVVLTNGGTRACQRHPVNVTGSNVTTAYVGQNPNTDLLTFQHRYHRGGQLLSRGETEPDPEPPPIYPTDGLMLHVDAAVNATGRSLDPTADMPDIMTATHIDSGVKYWTSNPAAGQAGYMLWNADSRWQASGSYTVCGWFYKRSDTRQIAWSQFAPESDKKFNWGFDSNREYHNNMVASGPADFNGGPWYDLNTWHFHAMTYENGQLLKISVDGQPGPVVASDFPAGQGPHMSSVSLLSRNDDFAPERFDGHVAQAWYYNRALSDAELSDLYANTKARYGVSRPYSHTFVSPEDGLVLHVDAAVNATGQSLDVTNDLPDVMTMTHVDSGVKYWTSNPAGGGGGYMKWAADPRWQAPSYTVAGWFYKRTDGRQIIWSQFAPSAQAKFNWAADPGREYHNNMIASGGVDYNGGPWYGLNTWHFHALTYSNEGLLTISVDGQPAPIALVNYAGGQSAQALAVTLGARNDDSPSERFDGHIAQAWYFARALDGDELSALYHNTKSRYGVDRVYRHDPLYPVDGLMLHVDAAINTTGQSLDTSADMPDLMTMTHVNTAPQYWTSGAGAGGYMMWNADSRWQPSGSYTVAGWFYKRSDARQALWSQFTGGTGAKFNWMADPNREYHNNMTSSGGVDYNGGPWYALNAWHFHAITYTNKGQFRISVDGQPYAVATATYPGDQSNRYTSVAIGARNDGVEKLDGHVAQAWYYGRALTDQELIDLYTSTKARYGVDRVYNPAAP